MTTSIHALDIRRRLPGGRGAWTPPAPFGPDGWCFTSTGGCRSVYRNGWAYQVFAPPADHVNIHEHALHLFGRLDGKPALPDFTYGTGSI